MLVLLALQAIKLLVELSLTILIEFGLIRTTDVFAQQKVQTSLSNEAYATTQRSITKNRLTNLKVGVVDAFGREVLQQTRCGFLCAFDTALRQTTLDVVRNVEFDCARQGFVQTTEEFLDGQEFGQADRYTD